jgi:hypothetical protein
MYKTEVGESCYMLFIDSWKLDNDKFSFLVVGFQDQNTWNTFPASEQWTKIEYDNRK